MKKIASLLALLAIPSSLSISAHPFMDGLLGGGFSGRQGNSCSIPPPVTFPPPPPGNPGGGPIFSSTIDYLVFEGPGASSFVGSACIFENMVEIYLGQPRSVTSVTITNLDTGAHRSSNFGGIVTDCVELRSPSSNGLWDICIMIGGVEYHALVLVNCYPSSMYECPMD